MAFDFEGAFKTTEAFTPGDRMLMKGKYVVTIKEIDGSGESRNGFPTIELKADNAEGYVKDTLYISPKEFAVAKIVGLIQAAGLERPTGDDIDEDDGRLSKRYLKRLVDKKVGVVIDEEEGEDREGNARMWPRVRGYVDPTQIHADIPTDSPSTGDFIAGGTSKADDGDIPF